MSEKQQAMLWLLLSVGMGLVLGFLGGIIFAAKISPC